MRPFQIVKDFENAVAKYCGAPYCVAVNSCTNALFLSLMWNKQKYGLAPFGVEIPTHTYISVPMQIKLSGNRVRFRQEEWSGAYKLDPYNIWDSARRFTSGMFETLGNSEKFMCTSHHWNKVLGIQQGGCILHNSPHADSWLRRARFDGRAEGVHPCDDRFDAVGWHMYMSPEIAAEGLVRLSHLPLYNADLPNDEYPDLSKIELFK